MGGVLTHDEYETKMKVHGPGADLQSVDVSWPGGRFGRDGPSSLGRISRASIRNVSVCISMYHRYRKINIFNSLSRNPLPSARITQRIFFRKKFMIRLIRDDMRC